jgi:DNA invertase Pin-like site-specific DNA recombinase
MALRTAIYTRISTNEQNTLAQEQELRRYAELKGYIIHKVYTDTISGSKSSRPGLNELMIDSRKDLFDIVICYKLDRLGRSLQHLLNIADEWRKRGIAFICTSQGIETITASGKLVYSILGAIAEFERELISERTKQGLKHAVNVGKRGKDKHPRKKGGYYLRYHKAKDL